MHILIIPSEQFVPEHNPGAGIFQYHQAKILSTAGHRVGVISVSQSFAIPMMLKALAYKCLGKKVGNACDEYSFFELVRLLRDKMYHPEKFIKNYKKDDISVVSADGFWYLATSMPANNRGWFEAAMAAFTAYKKEYGLPDVIHAHNVLSAGITASAISKMYELPYIITEHSSMWTRGEITNASLLSAAKKAYLHSSKTYAVSTDFKDKLNKQFSFDKIEVLPNVIDPQLEKRIMYVPEAPTEKFIFFHLAEMKPVKDQGTLLQAMKLVVEKNNDVELWMAGDGPLREELEELAKTLGIMDYVKFMGFLDRKDVYHSMTNSHCLVMCSLYETFGVVLIEAMTFGKPVIATNEGGSKDIVGEGQGLLVDKQNPEALANAMLKIMNHSNAYDNRAISEYVVDKFGAKKFLSVINKTYEEAIS